jgi:hypothetical protein
MSVQVVRALISDLSQILPDQEIHQVPFILFQQHANDCMPLLAGHAVQLSDLVVGSAHHVVHLSLSSAARPMVFPVFTAAYFMAYGAAALTSTLSNLEAEQKC